MYKTTENNAKQSFKFSAQVLLYPVAETRYTGLQGSFLILASCLDTNKIPVFWLSHLAAIFCGPQHMHFAHPWTATFPWLDMCHLS